MNAVSQHSQFICNSTFVSNGTGNNPIRELVIRLWNEGLSFAEISQHREIKPYDKTKNAIVGIVTRYKGDKREGESRRFREKIIARQIIARRKRVEHVKPPTSYCPKQVALKLLAEGEPEVIGPVEDFPPAGHCRYTHDDPRLPGWRMCGHKSRVTIKGSLEPWCPYHWEYKVRDKGRAETKEEAQIRILLKQKEVRGDIMERATAHRHKEAPNGPLV